jgi:hypothetical protein
MNRTPLRLLVAGLVPLLLAACTSGGTPISAPSSPPAGPSVTPTSPAPGSLLSASPQPGHVWWGIGGDRMLSVLPRLEREIGRPFAIVRTYIPWDQHIPDALIVDAATHGTIPYVSWDLTRTRGPQLTFADVADGSQDPTIRKQARAIRDSGAPMFFTFAHEPETAQGHDGEMLGSASEYVAAYERVHRIFQQLKVTNVHWVVTLNDRTYLGAYGGAHTWLPPPGDYTYLGVDGNLTWPCERQPGNQSFEQLFGPAEQLSKQLRKPLFIGEAGVQEFTACGNRHGTPQGKANWITAAAATAKTWPNLAAICWTYGSDRVHPDVTLVWNEDSSAQSLAAFRAAGLDLYFGRIGMS